VSENLDLVVFRWILAFNISTLTWKRPLDVTAGIIVNSNVGMRNCWGWLFWG